MGHGANGRKLLQVLLLDSVMVSTQDDEWVEEVLRLLPDCGQSFPSRS
jgi:hypothetical protein